MKYILKILIFTITLILLGCSDAENNEKLQNFLSIRIGGIDYTFDTFSATKKYDNYEVLALNISGDNFYLEFNENGVLGLAKFYSTEFGGNLNYESSFYYSKESFNLNNLLINDENKVIKGSFNGIIYENAGDVKAKSIIVNQGVFNMVYKEKNEDVNIYIDAKINNEQFESMKHSISDDRAGDLDLVYGGISDNEYIISIKINRQSVQPGSYLFLNSNLTNSFSVYYLNPYIDYFENFDVSGVLIIDEVLSFQSRTSVVGSFSGEAINQSGNNFNISNGVFSITY